MAFIGRKIPGCALGMKAVEGIKAQCRAQANGQFGKCGVRHHIPGIPVKAIICSQYKEIPGKIIGAEADRDFESRCGQVFYPYGCPRSEIHTMKSIRAREADFGIVSINTPAFSLRGSGCAAPRRLRASRHSMRATPRLLLCLLFAGTRGYLLVPLRSVGNARGAPAARSAQPFH